MPSSATMGEELTGIVLAGANPTGGWGYYAGKLSRIEPTCWAMLALAGGAAASAGAGDVHQQFLVGCQRADGLLSDRSDLPENLSWSALALLAVSTLSATSQTGQFCERLREALVRTAGVQTTNSPRLRQDNTLKGWPWIPATFSWVEPTSWCLLALKRAKQALPKRKGDPVALRIAEGEALLLDRVCESGGWNYGNASVFGASLPAHIPTTALGLLALQDKQDNPVVQRSLAFVEEHWRKESSGTALALSLVCLKVFGRGTDEMERAVIDQWQRTRFLGNLATTAMACSALSLKSSAVAALTLPS